MLGFKKGIPIAVVKGGARDGQILRLHSGSIDEENQEIADVMDDDDALSGIKNILDRLHPSFFDKYKKLKLGDIHAIRKSIQTLTRPEDNEMHAEVYDVALESIKKNLRKEIILPSTSKLRLLPSEEVVERLYVSGQSGSGKSTFVSNWLSESRKIWKNRHKKDIFIMSRVQEDAPLDKFKPIRVELNDEILIEPIEAEDLEDSVVIFDDIDTIANTRVRKTITMLRDDLLECGRHYNVRMLCTSHLLLAGHQTKKMLNEATTVVVFPRSGQVAQIKRYLSIYCGFEKDVINKIMNLPSRWVAVRRLYPSMVIYERGAFVVV